VWDTDGPGYCHGRAPRRRESTGGRLDGGSRNGCRLGRMGKDGERAPREGAATAGARLPRRGEQRQGFVISLGESVGRTGRDTATGGRLDGGRAREGASTEEKRKPRRRAVRERAPRRKREERRGNKGSGCLDARERSGQQGQRGGLDGGETGARAREGASTEGSTGGRLDGGHPNQRRGSGLCARGRLDEREERRGEERRGEGNKGSGCLDTRERSA
jgi:hypothetical protein